MNIFFLDTDPVKAAEYHCDKHAVKMIVETAQMMSTIYREKTGSHRHVVIPVKKRTRVKLRRRSVPLLSSDTTRSRFGHLILLDTFVYMSTHGTHPCTMWAKMTAQNYEWLAKLGIALCAEYTKRYNRVHATQPLILYLATKGCLLRRGSPDTISMPPLVMPDEYSGKTSDGFDTHPGENLESVVERYRDYYAGDKRSFAKWKLGNEPGWFTRRVRKTDKVAV